MVYSIIGLVLIIVGAICAFRFILESSTRRKDRVVNIAVSLILTSILLGFGIHFILLGLGL
ncbi:MAG: hypothetical protein ACTSSJ_01635 [Candidatus Odinarchaeia archaeon]